MNSLTWSSSKFTSPHKRLSNASIYIFTAHGTAAPRYMLISPSFLSFQSFVMCVRRHFFFISRPADRIRVLNNGKYKDSLVGKCCAKQPPCVQKIKIKSSTSVCTRARLSLSIQKPALRERRADCRPAGPIPAGRSCEMQMRLLSTPGAAINPREESRDRVLEDA